MRLLRRRATVRWRLAIRLAAVVLLTAVVLLVASLLLVDANLSGQRTTPVLSTPANPPGPPQPSSELVHQTLSALLWQYGIILAALAVVAGVVAWVVAGRALRPLRTITETARRITGHDLHERLALSGPEDELKELGDTFDSMLNRLDAAFQNQQLFAANAAHELRTPLSVMRAELDLLLTGPRPSAREVREVATRLRRAVATSERLIDRLLSLTRGSVASGDREPVPLDEIARTSLDASAAALGDQGLTVHGDLRGATADGDPSLLGELVGNLLENAIKYNRPQGWIAVSTRTEDGHAILEVTNSGETLAAEEVAVLIQPFRRGGQQRVGDGSGLGLSIVRTIVEAHGGDLKLDALQEGGLAVRVSLPAAAQTSTPDDPHAVDD